MEYGEHRGSIASLVKSWRPPTTEGSSTIKVDLSSLWSTLPSSKVSHSHGSATDSTFATLSTSFDLTADKDACSYATNLLTATVKQSAPSAKVPWARPEWHEVDLHHEGPEVFKKVGWMLSKIPEWDTFREWQKVSSEVTPLPAERPRPQR